MLGNKQDVIITNMSSQYLYHFIRHFRDWQQSIPGPIDSQTFPDLPGPLNKEKAILSETGWHKKMPRTGIEPVTRGFSVLCSTN